MPVFVLGKRYRAMESSEEKDPEPLYIKGARSGLKLMCFERLLGAYSALSLWLIASWRCSYQIWSISG